MCCFLLCVFFVSILFPAVCVVTCSILSSSEEEESIDKKSAKVSEDQFYWQKTEEREREGVIKRICI